MRAARVFLAGVSVAFVVATACTGLPSTNADPVRCSGLTLGTPTSPIDFEFLVANGDYQVAALHDGDALPILIPPQGGHVVFVGVRATNLDSCGIQLTGALRDEASQQVRFDQRTINLIPTGDGWGTTGPVGMAVSGTVSNFANIPVCPNEWSSTDVYGHVYALEVTLADASGRSLKKTIHVTPMCQPGDLDDCECTCAKGYVLGGVCPAPVDGGPDAS